MFTSLGKGRHGYEDSDGDGVLSGSAGWVSEEKKGAAAQYSDWHTALRCATTPS